MKTKKIIIIAVVIILISIAVILFAVLKKGASSKRTKNKSPKRILFVGDSQSAIKTDDGKDISFTYPRLIKNLLEPKGYEVDALGSVGKTTLCKEKRRLDSIYPKKKRNTGCDS